MFYHLRLKRDNQFHAGMNTQAILAYTVESLSGEPDYFGRNEISSGGDLSHYSSASLY